MRKLLFILVVATFACNSFAYYQTERGRWISRDPIEETGGINIYGYVDNSPLNKIDHLGQDSWASFPGNFISPSDAGFQMAKYNAPPMPRYPSTTSGTYGGGGYYVFGGSGSVTLGTCCENNKKYKYIVVKACTGMGIGASLDPLGLGGSVSTASDCPPELEVTVGAGLDVGGFVIGGEADLISGNTTGPGFGDANMGITWKIVEVCTHTRTLFEEDGCCDE